MKFLLPLLLLVIFGCSTDKTQYYTMDDYLKVDKLDSHSHLFSENDALVNRAKENNFRLLTVMVDHGPKSELLKQYEWALYQVKKNPGLVRFVTAFPMEGWDEPGWAASTISWIDSTIKAGAVGVKVWKNIGMEFKDKNGKLVMIDDPKFDTIFKWMAEKKIPLLGHLGEPRNCWLPLDQMTTKDDRNYFTNNPQYHMYLHPEFPSYEDQIAARDNMLEKNPDLVFVGAHMGSLEWNIDEIAKRFEKFPNMNIDLAARFGHVHLQTAADREKVRNFFIKYQDRILYGTDQADMGKTDEAENTQNSFYDTWKDDFKFLSTDEKMKDRNIDNEFQGLKLPKEVVDKVFIGNGSRIFNIFKK